MVKSISLVLAVLVSGAAMVWASEKSSVEVTADYYGKHIWRGQSCNDKSVLQPGISVTGYGFTGSIWGNLDLTNKNDNEGEFSEFDYTLDYTSAMPGVEGAKFSLGTIYYRFPQCQQR